MRKFTSLAAAAATSAVLALGMAACSSSPDSTVSSGPSTSAPAKHHKAGTVSERQAILAAKQYLSTQPFSKKDLIKQLKFDKYSTADAKYAVNHIKVDWNAQAVKAGEQYLSTQPFSRAGLVEQLKFDGFTEAQAKHGAKIALSHQ